MKKIFLVLVIIYLFAPLSAYAELTKNRDTNSVSLDIKKGWNLVPIYLLNSSGTNSWSVPGLSGKYVEASFIFDPITKQYISNIKSDAGKHGEITSQEQAFLEKGIYTSSDKDFFSNTLVSAFWIYSRQDAKAQQNLLPDTVAQEIPIRLYKGWNLFSILPSLLGYNLKDIEGNCSFTKVAIWRSDKQQWAVESVSSTIENRYHQGDIGEAMFVKVAQDCKLEVGDTPVGVPPPPIPE